MFKRWLSLFRVLTRRRDFGDRMSEELRFHVEQYIDELARSGMSPEKAARLGVERVQPVGLTCRLIAAVWGLGRLTDEREVTGLLTVCRQSRSQVATSAVVKTLR
jgi:hypothetical protein